MAAPVLRSVHFFHDRVNFAPAGRRVQICSEETLAVLSMQDVYTVYRQGGGGGCPGNGETSGSVGFQRDVRDLHPLPRECFGDFGVSGDSGKSGGFGNSNALSD